MHPYTEQIIADYREAYENGSEEFKIPSGLSHDTIMRGRIDAIQAKQAYYKDMEDQDDYLDRVLKVPAYCYIACVSIILFSLLLMAMGVDRLVFFCGVCVGIVVAILGDVYARSKTKHIKSLAKYYVAMELIAKEMTERL